MLEDIQPLSPLAVRRNWQVGSMWIWEMAPPWWPATMRKGTRDVSESTASVFQSRTLSNDPLCSRQHLPSPTGVGGTYQMMCLAFGMAASAVTGPLPLGSRRLLTNRGLPHPGSGSMRMSHSSTHSLRRPT